VYVGGVGVCSYVACTHKSELVNDNYYAQEIKYQKRIDSLDRAQALGTHAAASYDDSSKRIRVALPAEHAGKSVTGRIELYRPSKSGSDQEVNLAPDAKGVQFVDAAGLAQGLWHVRLAWNLDGQDYFLEQKLVVGPASLQAKLAALSNHGQTLNAVSR
jgi:nitrogen fixation protein FixH